MLVTLLVRVGVELTAQGKCCCRGKEGSGLMIETRNLMKSNSIQVLHNRI